MLFFQNYPTPKLIQNIRLSELDIYNSLTKEYTFLKIVKKNVINIDPVKVLKKKLCLKNTF